VGVHARHGKPAAGVSGSALVPTRPTAGKALAAALVIVGTDINEVLGQGRVACTLKVGTKSVRATRAGFASGVAVCSWKLPKSAKGKLLRGAVSVTFGGATVKRSFSVRVR
jgi:hypothetical protein